MDKPDRHLNSDLETVKSLPQIFEVARQLVPAMPLRKCLGSMKFADQDFGSEIVSIPWAGACPRRWRELGREAVLDVHWYTQERYA